MIKTQTQSKVMRLETRIAYLRRNTLKWVYLYQKQGKLLPNKIKHQLKEQEFRWKVKWVKNSNKHFTASKTFMETKAEAKKVKSLMIQMAQALNYNQCHIYSSKLKSNRAPGLQSQTSDNNLLPGLSPQSLMRCQESTLPQKKESVIWLQRTEIWLPRWQMLQPRWQKKLRRVSQVKSCSTWKDQVKKRWLNLGLTDYLV